MVCPLRCKINDQRPAIVGRNLGIIGHSGRVFTNALSIRPGLVSADCRAGFDNLDRGKAWLDIQRTCFGGLCIHVPQPVDVLL